MLAPPSLVRLLAVAIAAAPVAAPAADDAERVGAVVEVEHQGGSVVLSAQGQGTDIPSPFDPPGPARPWSADKIARAVAIVTLH